MDTRLTLLHAPEDESNTTEEEGTAYTTDNASNDLLVGIADATAIVAVACLCSRWVCDNGLPSGGKGSAGACRGCGGYLAILESRGDGPGVL